MLARRDFTGSDIFVALFSENSRDKIDALTQLVQTLLMEVEALRAAAIEDGRAPGTSSQATAYARAYRRTALLSHNAAGPSTGIEKLLARWISPETTCNGIAVPEILMLRRLGYSEDEIRRYMQEAEQQEALS
jgi:hypothetical protein